MRLVLAALAVSAYAETAAAAHANAGSGEWRASPWLGWEFASMSAVEGELRIIAEQARDEFTGGLAAWGETVSGEITERKAGGGIGFGIEIGRMVSPSMGAGLRAGTVAFPGQNARYEGTGSAGETYRDTWALDHQLTFVMGGLWLEGGNPRGLSWRGSVFVGPAYADSAFAQTGEFVDPLVPSAFSWDGKGRLTGSTLAFEADARAAWLVGRGVSVFAEAGFLGAPVREMRWRSDVDIDGDGKTEYRQGTILLSNKAKQPLEFDFSGLRIRAGITVAFGGRPASGGASNAGVWEGPLE